MDYAFLLGLLFDADDGTLFVILLPVKIYEFGLDAHRLLLGVDGFEEQDVGKPVQRGLDQVKHQVEKLHELELVSRVVLVHVFEHRLVLVERADEVLTVDALFKVGVILHEVEEELFGVKGVGCDGDELFEFGALLLHLVHHDVDQGGQKIGRVGFHNFLEHARLRVLPRQIVVGRNVHVPEGFVAGIVLRMHLFGFDVHCSETVLESQLAAFLRFLFGASFELAVLLLQEVAPERHPRVVGVDFSLSFGLYPHYVLQFEVVFALADFFDVNILSQLELVIHVPALLIANELRYPLIEGQLALGVFVVAMNGRDSGYYFFQEGEYLVLVEVLQFEVLGEEHLHVGFCEVVERLHLLDPQLQVLEC